MAQYTHERPITVESVTAPEPLVICRATADQPTFIMTCDDTALRWLESAFRALGGRRMFVIGDGSPIGSDGVCVITVGAAASGQLPTLLRLAPGSYRWSLPESEARRIADKLHGMAAFSGPCHQYLEIAPGLPAVIASKGEYGAATLRRMRA